MRFLFLLLDEIREIEEEESELFEGLTSQQIFLWLQGLFLFALVWTVAGTINADSIFLPRFPPLFSFLSLPK